jgi:succinate dehydrogenase/fumarate reductase flavoprotein subunit
MLPPETNFFRTAASLAAGRARLDRCWSVLRDRPAGAPDERLKSREAAALLAASRWALACAEARLETRGMHRRTDYPDAVTASPRRVVVAGLDRLAVSTEPGADAPLPAMGGEPAR